MFDQRPTQEQLQEDEKRSFKNALAIKWRMMEVEYGGKPSTDVWAAAKFEIRSEHSDIEFITRNLGIDTDKAFAEACAELQL